ncbi:hypothetical protein [Lewinella sp. 4G2]|uniref:hypothetical protein n=1 Tax=Lewinella sp. 4G2 TaxID=1803372 RepID=UPI0007B4843C|nr:hypothetical protein [Lewinella sp. 4G2]OAV43607.1 hypothetical protein A3850_003445 [Lewinella sp. 4G2]
MPENQPLELNLDPAALRDNYPELEAKLKRRGFIFADLSLTPTNRQFNAAFQAVVEEVIALRHRAERPVPRFTQEAKFQYVDNSVSLQYIVRQPQPIAGPVYILEPCQGNLTLKISSQDGGTVNRQPLPSASLHDKLSRTPTVPETTWYLDLSQALNYVQFKYLNYSVNLRSEC